MNRRKQEEVCEDDDRNIKKKRMEREGRKAKKKEKMKIIGGTTRAPILWNHILDKDKECATQSVFPGGRVFEPIPSGEGGGWRG